MAITITQRPHQYCFSRNPVQYTFNITEYADAGALLHVRLYMRDIGGAAGTEVEVYDEKIKPPAQVTTYNMQDLIDAQLSYQLPDFSGSTFQTNFPGIKEFFITYRVITDAITDPSFFTEGAKPRYVIKGGIANPQWDWNNYFINYVPTSKPFLTWQPNNRFIGAADEFFISFLNTLSVADAITLKIDVQYTDGSSTSADQDFGDNGEKLLYHINAGAVQLGLTALDPTKTIYKYTLQVIKTGDDSTVYTAPYTYYIDYRTFYNTKFLHYYNSLGGMESVRIRGEIESGINRNYSESEKYSGPHIIGAPPAEQYIQSGLSKVDAYKGEVGYLHTQKEADVLQEVYMTRFIWERLRLKNIMISILNKNASLGTTNDKKWSQNIEWRYSHTNTVYTPLDKELGTGVDQETYGGGGGGVCEMPSGLTITAITDTTATATWAEPNPVPGSGYEWELWDSTLTTMLQSGSGSAASVNLTGLTASELYYVTVRSVCGVGDESGDITVPFNTAASGGGLIGYVQTLDPFTGANGTASRLGNITDLRINIDGGVATDQNIARAYHSAIWPAHFVAATTANVYDSSDNVVDTVQLTWSTGGYIAIVGSRTFATGEYILVTFDDS